MAEIEQAVSQEMSHEVIEHTTASDPVCKKIEDLVPSFSESQNQKKQSILSKIGKSLLKGAHNEFFNGIIPADDAFLKATYGTWTNKKEMVKKLIVDINENIKSCVERGHLHLLISVEPEIMNYTSQIAEAYKSYGYQVYILNKESLERIDPQSKVNNTRAFLLFMWDKVY